MVFPSKPGPPPKLKTLKAQALDLGDLEVEREPTIFKTPLSYSVKREVYRELEVESEGKVTDQPMEFQTIPMPIYDTQFDQSSDTFSRGADSLDKERHFLMQSLVEDDIDSERFEKIKPKELVEELQKSRQLT